MKEFKVENHADSFLPEDKNWKLVWSDEFDGTELDRGKWGFRLNFWGKPFPAFTEEGVVLDGKSHLQLHLLKQDGGYCSPHLQTGSLTYDIPKDTEGFWPFGKFEEPRFMHRYGYYEIRCRLPKCDGWHSAFWLQAPGIGSSPDPRRAGVECDIMENMFQYTSGKMIGGNYWGGYGTDRRRMALLRSRLEPRRIPFLCRPQTHRHRRSPGKGSPRTHGQRHGKELSSAGGLRLRRPGLRNGTVHSDLDRMPRLPRERKIRSAA